MKYQVDHEDENGAVETATYHGCKNVGSAFAQCQKEFPGHKMLHATASSGLDQFSAKTEYEPVPVQRDPIKEPRPYRAPKPNERDGVMPFYDDALNQKALS